MTKQLEFPFMAEIRKMDKETCNRCKYATIKEGICNLTGEEISGDGTCNFWENDINQDIGEIANECKNEFNNLMDKYSVSEEDKQKIYSDCKWF